MIVDDQAEVIGFLSDPANYPCAARVERIDTHSASVFLAGDRAYKLKRAVRYDYLDFSTLEKRRIACHAEVALNRRSAPLLYLGATPLTRRDDGHLQFGGRLPAVEWLVVMRRFPQEQLLDRLAAASALPLSLMRPLADAVARFHKSAEPRRQFGGAGAIARVIDGNERALACGAAGLDRDAGARLARTSREMLALLTPLLDSRRDRGFVRQCHGDLHLRNIVLIDGRPTVFDAIEFDDALACIDVQYDLAFLLMDLLARDLPAHANVVFNAYLARTDDVAGAAAMPLFLSIRAAIRAKTSVAAMELQDDAARRAELAARAATYLQLADRLLASQPPRLVAIGGLSGTGKSTLAAALAPGIGMPPGAIVLRSDVIRKQLLGADLDTRLPETAYAPSMSARVYAALRAHARTALRGGLSVIADAVFADERDRLAIASVADAFHVPFTGLWLHAEPAILRGRLQARQRDVSDATPDILNGQLHRPCGRITWDHVAAEGDPAATAALAREVLRAEHAVQS